MKKIFFLLSLLLITINCKEDYPKEEDVLILTDTTFDKATTDFKNILVLFYAPWCGHCKKFHPEFSKAATTLKNESLYLAKVDATENKKLAEKYKITSYPTIKLFSNGRVVPYESGRTEKSVVDWMRKKTGKNVKDITNIEECEKFINEKDVSVLYFGNDENSLIEFNVVAMINDDFVFGQSNNSEIKEKYNLKDNSVTLFKKFDEKRNDYNDEIKEEKLLNFLEKYGTPKILPWNDKTIAIIFRKTNPALFLFINKVHEKYNDYRKLMESVYEKIGTEIKIIMMGLENTEEKRFGEWFGIKENELPSIRIGDPRNRGFSKYKMEGEINESNIIKFFEDWKNNKLHKLLKSEDIPKENKEPVFKIVSKNFKDEVINNDKDVLIKFYAPWCGHCKALAPTYIDLAKKLKNNSKLLIAECDATANEFEDIDIRSYPTIKFWPGNNKNQKPIDFPGERTVDGFIKFLRENAYHMINVDENKGDL